MTAYYNEIDKYAAQWLRNLIAAGHIAPGDVDERSIEEVTADDIKGYTQCHFFAGIAGWSLALRFAGWPDDREVWTGSCPCQPFSVAGKQGGADDERHLWPAFQRLIAQQKPATVFGEQVASSDGRTWFAAVRLDLETLGYACGAADLCAAGVGAPHIRQRLWWVADSPRAPQSRQRPKSVYLPRQTVDWGRGTFHITKGGTFRQVPLEPSLFPLAYGLSGDLVRALPVPSRKVALKGAGNAIVPQVAAEFIGAYMEVTKPFDR